MADGSGVQPLGAGHALTVRGLTARWGEREVLKPLDLTLRRGTITALVGANGAGKTSLLMALSGLCTFSSGEIFLEDTPLHGCSAHERVKRGLVHCPEGRRVFARLTTEENLYLGAYIEKDPQVIAHGIEQAYALYPRLKQRRRQLAGTLSGGEQQMLALARATLSQPRVLLLDEPSLGLAPQITTQVFEAIQALSRQGITILLVEQNASLALRVAEHAYLLEMGRVALSGSAQSLLEDKRVRQAYLGDAKA